MTLMEIVTGYVNYLWQAFQFDIEVFSKGWMYWPLCIPAFGYLVFFVGKWSVLTAPIWAPIRGILQGASGIRTVGNYIIHKTQE